MSKSAEAVAQAFEQGSGVAPLGLSLLFIACSVGILLVFGLFLILKKANKTKDESPDEFLKTTVIFIIAIIVMLLISALVTVST